MGGLRIEKGDEDDLWDLVMWCVILKTLLGCGYREGHSERLLGAASLSPLFSSASQSIDC